MDIYLDVVNRFKEADLVLIGIGEEADMNKSDCEKLLTFAEGKNYQIVSVSDNHDIDEVMQGAEKYVNPVLNDSEEDWENYLKWLQGTLNKNLFVLELGVGFKYPDVIRFPFEKTVYYNRKAYMCRINENLYQLPVEVKDKGTSYKLSTSDFISEFVR